MSVHLIRRYHSGGKPRDTLREGSRLTATQQERVLEFIDAHLSQRIALSELARLAELSGTHFLQRFRNTFGEDLHRFVLNKRTQLAIELIGQRSLKLAEIGAASGFADQASMTHAVKRTTGLTPRAATQDVSSAFECEHSGWLQ